MKLLNKILWREGMHLSQHHFQAQGRYFEDTLSASLGQLFFAPFGLASIALDGEALRDGVISLHGASGIMPDGMPFLMPGGDDLPAARDIVRDFPPTEATQDVLLALPAHQPNAANVSVMNDATARYQVVQRSVQDSVNGQDSRAVEMARKNFRIILAREATRDEVTLPIARVRRDGTGHFVYDADFIPPCTKLDGSAALVELLERLLKIVDGKADAIAAERDASSKSISDFAASEIANFWLLHTLRTHSAALRHYVMARQAHPERAFLDLARLAGALCTFTLDGSPHDVPLYDHTDLTGCFHEVAAQVRSRLQAVKPGGCVRISLAKFDPHLFTAPIQDERCLRPKAKWVLGLRTSARNFALAARVPELVKVCSRRFAMRLVASGLPGLSLDAVPVPPSVLSPRADTNYFWIHRQGPCEDDILKTREVGVYIPDDIPDAEAELQVVLEAE